MGITFLKVHSSLDSIVKVFLTIDWYFAQSSASLNFDNWFSSVKRVIKTI